VSDLVGRTIAGRYQVKQFIGRGGMADVYKVWDTQRAADLAMKVLHDDLAEDQVFLRRFRREAQTLAKLKHPNIVRFYELGQDGDLVFMIMEFVDGITLGKATSRINKPFTPAQVLGVIQPVCAALHFAHNISLIHCDIKPANIMIDQTGRVLLTDFGIARMTEGAATATMVGAGTPAYMSPEQVAGAEPTPQADIYSLGVVLYYLFTGGQRPFTGERATTTGTIADKLRWEQRNLEPPSPSTYNPGISPELEAVILRCLAKNPRKRYGTVDELLNDLQNAIKVQPESLPSSVLAREEKPVDFPLSSTVSAGASPAGSRRNYWVAGGVVVIGGFLVICIIAGLLIFNGKPANPNSSSNTQNSLSAPTSRVVTQIVEVTSTFQPTLFQPTIPPAPTAVPPTYAPAPTAGPNFSVKQVSENDGYHMIVTGGPDNYNGDVGGLSQGFFLVGDNNKFMVYVDIGGNVFIISFHDFVLRQAAPKLSNKEFTFLINGGTPNFQLSFHTDPDNPGTYSLIIQELNYGGKATIRLDRRYTN